MKRRVPTRWAIVLVWLATLALAFWLGSQVVSPGRWGAAGAAAEADPDRALDLQQAALIIERVTGQPWQPGTWQDDAQAPQRYALALGWAADQPDRARALYEVQLLSRVLSLAQVAQTVAVLAAGGAGDLVARPLVATELFWRWGQLDPYSSLRFAEQEVPAGPRLLVLGAALGGWASRDLPAATAWLQARADGDARLWATLLRAVDPADPGTSATLLESLPPALAREAGLAWTAHLLETQQWDAVAGAIAPLQRGPLRATLAGFAARQAAARHPADAVAFLQRLGADGVGSLPIVFGLWAYHAPAEAAQAANRLAPGSLRATSLLAVAEGWTAASGPSALAHWFGQQPLHADHDLALQYLAVASVSVHPATAWEWAQVIGDARLRLEAQMEVAQRWLLVDPGAAMAAVQARLDPAAQEWLLGAPVALPATAEVAAVAGPLPPQPAAFAPEASAAAPGAGADAPSPLADEPAGPAAPANAESPEE